MKRQPLFYLLTCVLLALFTASCRTRATMDIHVDGITTTTMEFEGSDDMMQRVNQTCAGLRVHFKQAGKFVENARMENVTSPGGRLRRELTSNKQLGENLGLIDDGKTYSFIYPDSNKGKQEYKDTKTRTTIVMPRKITRKTRDAIEGNKAIIDGLDYLTNSFSVVSGKNDETSKPIDSSSPTKRADSLPSPIGLPARAQTTIGTDVLVVITVLAFIAGRYRGAAKAAASDWRDRMLTGGSHVPPPGGGTSPHQQVFGDGSGQGSQGRIPTQRFALLMWKLEFYQKDNFKKCLR